MQGNTLGFSSERKPERKAPKSLSVDNQTDAVQVEIETTNENRIVYTRKCMMYTTITIILIGCGIGLGIWYVIINN